MVRRQRARELVAPLSVLLTLLLGAPRPGAGQTARSVTTASSQSQAVVSGQGQSPFAGSVPTGQATGTTLPLSLREAVDRALKYNLGVIESGQNIRAARAARLRGLNALLPQLSARVTGTIEQINLRALGLTLSFPGVRIPTIVGPFGVEDARAYLSQQIFNWSDIKNWKSASESVTASQYSYRSDRDLVVFTTGNAYLVVISDGATVDTIRAQLKTAQTLYQRAVDQHAAGVVARIDELRAQVEWQTQQQSLPTRHWRKRRIGSQPASPTI